MTIERPRRINGMSEGQALRHLTLVRREIMAELVRLRRRQREVGRQIEVKTQRLKEVDHGIEILTEGGRR